MKNFSVKSKIKKLEIAKRDNKHTTVKYLIMDIATYAELIEEMAEDEGLDKEVAEEIMSYEGEDNVYTIATVQDIDYEILELR